MRTCYMYIYTYMYIYVYTQYAYIYIYIYMLCYLTGPVAEDGLRGGEQRLRREHARSLFVLLLSLFIISIII